MFEVEDESGIGRFSQIVSVDGYIGWEVRDRPRRFMDHHSMQANLISVESASSSDAVRMTEYIHSPRRLEPETAYTIQTRTLEDELRAITRARDAEASDKLGVNFSDVLVAMICPCVSVAQIASSIGYPFGWIRLLFALLYLAGPGSILLIMYDSRENYLTLTQLGYFFAIGVVIFILGPIISFLLVIAVIFSTGDGIGVFWSFYIFGPALVVTILFKCAASQFRHKVRRRINSPMRSEARQTVLDVCCVWFPLATGTSVAKKYKRTGYCYLGPLDTIPPYLSTETSRR